MENIFLELFNMSINAGWLVLAIILFRLIFKKAPKSLRVIMWGLVALRLVCPFSFESVLSIIPSAEPVPPEIVYSNSSADVSGAEIFNAIGNNQVYYDLGVQDGSIVFTEYSAPDGDFINPLLIITYIASIVWIVGMVAMLLYTLISYLRILKNVREAAPLKENIWVCDNISTPFILGIIKPRIFLPSSMNEQDMEFVIAHEKAHLKRRDHWWKPLGFALLTVYWFNPVLWVAYVLLCRDIELACDEKVIKEMGTEIKKPYSDALINCSVPRKMISACPLAFGETGVKGRIKSVLNYKKPAFWVIIVAVIMCVITAVCFLTNPQDEINLTNSILVVEKYYYDNVIGEDRANKEMNDVVYKIDSENQLYRGDTKGIDWHNEGELQAVSDESLWNIAKEYLPFYYKGLRLDRTYVAEDENNSACVIFITENNKIFIAILPRYNTEKMYVMDFLEVKQEELVIEKSEPLGIANVTNGSEYDGVSISFMSASFTGDSRHMEIEWSNQTDQAIMFGEEIHIFKKNGTKWEECKLPENYAWTSIGYLVEADSAKFHNYGLFGYEKFTAGEYRVETDFFFDENPQENYKVWLEFELVSINVANGDKYTPVKLVYDCAFSSFYQSAEIAPIYYVLKDKSLIAQNRNGTVDEFGKLTAVSLNEDNWNSKFLVDAIWNDGYSLSQINENNKKAWQVTAEDGNTCFLLEQKDNTYYIAVANKYNDDYTIRWLYLVEKNDTKINLEDTTSQEESSTEEETTKPYVPKPLTKLSEKKMLKIKQDYLEFNKDLVEMAEKEQNCNVIVEDVYLSKYYGSYGDCVAMMIDSRYFGKSLGDAETKIQVGDYLFAYPTLKQIDVYRNGKFSDLDEAYKKGWLSDEDVRDIHYYHSTKTYIEYEFYSPTPITPLSTEKAIKIKQDYLEYRKKSIENSRKPDRYNNKTIDDITINQYLGTYGRCIVVSINMNSDIPPADNIEEEVENYKFVYSSRKRGISVYRNGTFVSLSDAYEKGWLSKEDVRDIHYYYATDMAIKNIYTPSPLVPLTAEQELQIKQDYLEWRRKCVENTKSEGEYDDLTVDDVNLEHYFGTYNGCYVVLIEFYGDIHMDAETTEYIAGYRFDYNYVRTTKVYHNGEFINLCDAYSNGLLSKKDIQDIHYYHTTQYASLYFD